MNESFWTGFEKNAKSPASAFAKVINYTKVNAEALAKKRAAIGVGPTINYANMPPMPRR